MSQTNKFVKGAALLSGAALITKMLSALYKIPLQNLTGNEGFYVYQQVYPLYGIASVLALNGFPLYISKLISESEEEHHGEVIKQTQVWVTLFSISAFLFLFLLSDQVAQLMGDGQLAPVIRATSAVYLFIPFLSMGRGYFQGLMNMKPTALSQVAEQLVRVTLLIVVAVLFSKMNLSVYEMGTWAMRSSWIGALAGTGVVGLFFIKSRHQLQRSALPSGTHAYSKIGKRFLTEGLALTFMSSLLLMFQLIDSFTVYNGLIEGGSPSAQAMVMKGIYDRAQPFVQVGLVLGVSLATSTLPLLRNNHKAEQKEAWIKNSVRVLKLTAILSGAASVGLIAVMPWLNQALFQDRSGTQALQLYSLSVLILSVIHVMFAIIHSTSSSLFGWGSLLFGLAFKAAFNTFAVRTVGIVGSSFITVVSLMLIFLLLVRQLDKAIWYEMLDSSFILKYSLLLSIMGLSVYGILNMSQSVFGTSTRLTASISIFIGVLVGVTVIITALLKLDILTKEEWQSLTLIKKIKK
ncbi:MAG: polysaccharide biosynthesis protein [Alkalibacterium sp.]|uniref:putative polysaccharide biosynthesis protein n=1 Tax=Alkalibacterium sp. TaxID=1872447 RepID=UPI003970DF45